MKSFTQIVAPHEDIVKGKLTMDVFAADLWQVVKGKAPLDYQDPDLFFRKTYLTKGLRNIIEVAKARLEGKTGDSVIQLQTPFGGGKTHSLIALYHKAKEWNAKVVVFDGGAVKPEEVRLWEELEKQLTGKVELTKGNVSPGKEKLIELFSKHSPLLILIDEILLYITKAAGVKVGDSNLASQTLAFMQELTAAVSTVGNVLLVLTLPSSVLEHYDEYAERAFQQMQKITGRIEKIYAPVEDEEIEYVVRKRLFSEIKDEGVKKIVDEFIVYAKNEGLLSEDEIVSYRDKFLKSYPFKPEVIDTLYKRWGSFPTFQRTRGLLRLLSLVINDLLDKSIPFIRLGDFNLENNEIRRELIKHIGQEWDSIIAQDITSRNSGAKKIDESLGASYKPFKLGTVVTTTIFMMSFSGRGEKGASAREVKLSVAYPDFSSTVVDTVISELKERLFYLSDEGLYFTNQPNLNRIIIAREENVYEDEIREEERKLIERHISRAPRLRIYLFPNFPKDVPDTPELKLVILDKNRPDIAFLEKYGEIPRVYRNTLIFLCRDERQGEEFYNYLRRLLALRSINNDMILRLTEGQKKEIGNKLKNHVQREYEELRRYYRLLFLPSREGFKEIDMGIAIYGETLLDKEIYERLRNQGEILEKIAPKVIRDRFLSGKKYVETKKLYEALLKTPGEIRLMTKEGLIEGIRDGVKNGLFGLGYVRNGQIECKYLRDSPSVNLDEGEIIITQEACKESIEKIREPLSEKDQQTHKIEGIVASQSVAYSESREEEPTIYRKKYSEIKLRLNVPIGQLSTIVRIVNYMKTKFNQCNVAVTLDVSDGEILITEYEDKIKEALRQAGIEIKEENKK